MNRTSPDRQESIRKRQAEVPMPDRRAGGDTRSEQVSRSLKDALEDDEVREALKVLRQQGEA
jgi:hypothetical protein